MKQITPIPAMINEKESIIIRNRSLSTSIIAPTKSGIKAVIHKQVPAILFFVCKSLYFALRSLTIPLTPYSVSNFSFSKYAKGAVLLPLDINITAAIATKIIRAIIPIPPAISSLKPPDVLSLIAPNIKRAIGDKIHKKAAYAIVLAVLDFTVRNAFASSVGVGRSRPYFVGSI